MVPSGYTVQQVKYITRSYGPSPPDRFGLTDDQLGRMAVLPHVRGTGLAKRLCEAAHARAKGNGLKEVIADSQVCPACHGAGLDMSVR